MHFAIKTLLCVPLFCTSAWAVEVATPTQTTTAATPTTTQTAPKPAAAGVIGNNTHAQVTQTAANAAPTVNAQGQPIVAGEEPKPLTAEQIAKQKAALDAKVKALVKDQATRLQQLEKANLDALAQNQELQLKNDSLGVQVQVLQSERSAQMFLYGAATIAVGMFLGFLIASYIYTKRRRQW